MKTCILRTILAALLLLPSFHLQLSTLFAQGTAFTYQGQLKDGLAPANGSYDLTFSLFGVSSGGSAVGGPVINLATRVTNGLFTVSLDFGTGKFTGLERWLEIGARTNGSGSFATLAPRQPLTPTPYATYAASAGTGGGSPWSLNGSSTFYNGGRVGIGTTTPQASLHVGTADEGIRIQGASSGVANSAYMSFVNGAGTAIGFVGDGSTQDNSMYLGSYLANIYLYTPFGAVLTATPGGNVGIGTTTPQARLDVRGDIRLGASGQFRATSGEENLRIVRGSVDGNGTIDAGSGFSVVRGNEGFYTITFSTPFAGRPSVTVTPFRPDAAQERTAHLRTVSTTGVQVTFSLSELTLTDSDFCFIAIGPR